MTSNQIHIRPAVAVYGASSTDIHPAYAEAAREVGRLLALRGATVVNGGGARGLMGATIDGALRAGGEAHGVIPSFMHQRGWAHPGLTALDVTDGMHARKERMASLADAVIALPGGIGTLEELAEIITWRKLGLWHGPVVILDTRGYWQPLLDMLARMGAEGFTGPEHLWSVATTPRQAVTMALGPDYLSRDGR